MPRKTTRRQLKNETVNRSALEIEDQDSKAAKKAMFLNDFDMRVAEDVAEMERHMQDVLRNLAYTFTKQKNTFEYKKLKNIKVVDFLKNGGNLEILDLTEDVDKIIEVGEISFQESIPQATFKAPHKNMLPLRKSTRRGPAVQSPLVHNAPLGRGNAKRPVPKALPSIHMKYDIRKPVESAREPKLGETLTSLSGSPVVLTESQTMLSSDINCTEMSPSTTLNMRKKLQDLVNNLNSRIENMDSQISQQMSSTANSTNNTD